MKKIYLNLKRFDIPRIYGGVNEIKNIKQYGKYITEGIEAMNFPCDVTIYFPEAHIINAMESKKNVNIGCQGVFYMDAGINGQFGAFTTFKTATSMKALGVNDVIIGHCEERNYLNYLTNNSKTIDINQILNEEVKNATKLGMRVLYCIGEKDYEQPIKYEVLKTQILNGLKDVDLSLVTIAYEPVWAIGPGKTPPNKEYIQDIARYIKSLIDVEVVYGGGLKEENAEMIASIDEVDGGLIALTKFGKDFGFYLEDFKKIVDLYIKGERNEN